MRGRACCPFCCLLVCTISTATPTVAGPSSRRVALAAGVALARRNARREALRRTSFGKPAR